jgi:hypothetical protein
VVVTKVEPNSVAAKSGLRVGYVIMSIDGTEVNSPRNLDQYWILQKKTWKWKTAKHRLYTMDYKQTAGFPDPEIRITHRIIETGGNIIPPVFFICSNHQYFTSEISG